MKKMILFLLMVFGLIDTSNCQVVNQIKISPSNPKANDTILIISDFSFYGNCSYGLVDYYVDFAGSVINIFPIYCGYGDSTICNSIDTIKIGPFQIGNYDIHIEFHQGSICPISNFDALISQFDTSIVVNDFSSISNILGFEDSFKIFPNPTANSFVIDCKNLNLANNYHLKITNLMGGIVFRCFVNQTNNLVQFSDLESGIYFISIKNQEGVLMGIRKLVIQ
jgi:hypothetical protein